MQIHDGGQGMPPFADEMNAAEISDLVSYLRKKRRLIVPVASAPTAPPVAKPDPD